MNRNDRPPDYLIERIARHVRTLLAMPPSNTREANAQRLLRKEIQKLESYKRDERIDILPERGVP